MAFQNVFDTSACNVTVKQDATIIFSGAMAKGDSLTFADPAHAGETLTVSVDANGVLDLSGTFTGYGADFMSQYYVSASTSDPNSGGRVSNASVYATAGPTLQLSSYADGVVVDPLVVATPYCTPNPYDFAVAPVAFGCNLRIGG